jgi:hypothetical protein
MHETTLGGLFAVFSWITVLRIALRWSAAARMHLNDAFGHKPGCTALIIITNSLRQAAEA